MTAEELNVLITANANDLRKEINETKKQLNGLTNSANKTQSGIMSAFKKLKTGIVALAIGKIIKDSIQIGMDAVESDSLFKVSLGNMSDSVRAWSEELQSTLGVNAVSIRKNTGVIYNMTTSMGVAEENALKLSKGVAILSNDMASFYNISEEQAFEKIQSGLTGMSKPLKDLGILVDDATITQVAYQEGIAETGAELTEQQKVLARYVAILKQTGNAQGDLARTLDSPANQTRLFKSQITQLGLAFSNLLLPILKAVLPYITAFTKVVTSAVNGLSTLLSKVLGFKGGGASEETEKMASNIGGLGGDLDDANKSAKKLKSTLAGFDEMNVLKDNDTDSGSTSDVGGATASIGFDLGEYDAHLEWANNQTQKIADKITDTFKKVGEVIGSIWDSAPIQAYVGAVETNFTFIKDFVSTIATDIWTNLQMTWANCQLDVETALTNSSLLFTQFWTDITAGIQEWGQPVIDGVSKVFNSIWKDAIDPVCKQISKIWSDTSKILLDLWNEYGKPLIDNIGEFVTKTIALFQKIWDDVISPIVTPFLETLSWLWDNHLKGMVEELGKFIMKLVNGALEIYNKFIEPIVGFILDLLSPVWAGLCNLIIGVMGTIIGTITDVIKGVLSVLGGLIDFIVGIFTLNWSKAWDGIKGIFKGVFDALVGIFKAPINLIIDGINSFISALNKIKIPDWVPAVGGLGFNIPKIPKLAQGGVIDRPTLAEVGEAGKEVIMPLERNTGWINELADKINARGGNGQPIHLVVNIGEDTFLDKIIDGVNKKSFENNGEVFNI